MYVMKLNRIIIFILLANICFSQNTTIGNGNDTVVVPNVLKALNGIFLGSQPVSFVATNTVQVFDAGDFPEAVNDTIILDPNTNYILMDNIDLKDTILYFPTASNHNIYCTSFYFFCNTPDPFLTGDSIGTILFYDLRIINSGTGAFYEFKSTDAIGGGIGFYNLLNYSPFSVNDIGTFENLFLADFNNAGFVNCNTLVDKNNETFNMNRFQFVNSNAEPDSSYIKSVGDSTRSVSIQTFTAKPLPGEYVYYIDSLIGSESTINVSNQFALIDSNFYNPNGLDQTSIVVNSRFVSGVIDSKNIGCFAVQFNTDLTTIGTLDIWQDMDLDEATVACENIEQWEVVTDSIGEIVYIGREPFSGTIKGTVSSTSAGAPNIFRFGFMKNSDTLSVSMPNEISGTISNTGLSIPIEVVTGDTLKPQVKRRTGSSNITITDMVIEID